MKIKIQATVEKNMNKEKLKNMLVYACIKGKFK